MNNKIISFVTLFRNTSTNTLRTRHTRLTCKTCDMKLLHFDNPNRFSSSQEPNSEETRLRHLNFILKMSIGNLHQPIIPSRLSLHCKRSNLNFVFDIEMSPYLRHCLSYLSFCKAIKFVYRGCVIVNRSMVLINFGNHFQTFDLRDEI